MGSSAPAMPIAKRDPSFSTIKISHKQNTLLAVLSRASMPVAEPQHAACTNWMQNQPLPGVRYRLKAGCPNNATSEENAGLMLY